MKKQEQESSKLVTNLFATGAILVAIGAVVWLKFSEYSGWILAAGGLIMSISFLIGAIHSKADTLRTRRLERMRLLASLLYLVSGGFMIQGSGHWLALFMIGTVFFVYSAFVKDKKPSN